jgi:hypothetical protein
MVGDGLTAGDASVGDASVGDASVVVDSDDIDKVYL